MLNSDQEYGRDSEALAVAFLKQKGYKVLATNYRLKMGEIDVVAQDGRTIVFVEIKARRSKRYGHPKQALDFRKRRKLSRMAQAYLKTAGRSGASARFDVVAIIATPSGPEIELIRNAFEVAAE